MDILQFVGSVGGIAGVLAYLIFLAYKQEVKQMREDRKYSEERLTGIIDRDLETRMQNTAVLTELIVWLKTKNGNSQHP